MLGTSAQAVLSLQLKLFESERLTCHPALTTASSDGSTEKRSQSGFAFSSCCLWWGNRRKSRHGE